MASARSAAPRGSRPRRGFTCPLSPGARPTGCSKFRGEHLLPPPRVSVLPREAPVSSAFLRSQAKILKTECAERPRWEGVGDRLPAGEPLTALTGRTRMRSRGGGGCLTRFGFLSRCSSAYDAAPSRESHSELKISSAAHACRAPNPAGQPAQPGRPGPAQHTHTRLPRARPSHAEPALSQSTDDLMRFTEHRMGEMLATVLPRAGHSLSRSRGWPGGRRGSRVRRVVCPGREWPSRLREVGNLVGPSKSEASSN